MARSKIDLSKVVTFKNDIVYVSKKELKSIIQCDLDLFLKELKILLLFKYKTKLTDEFFMIKNK